MQMIMINIYDGVMLLALLLQNGLMGTSDITMIDMSILIIRNCFTIFYTFLHLLSLDFLFCQIYENAAHHSRFLYDIINGIHVNNTLSV